MVSAWRACAIEPPASASALARLLAARLAERALHFRLGHGEQAVEVVQSRAAKPRDVDSDEPQSMDDPRIDGLFGAVAEYLAHQFNLPRVPDWAFMPSRYLDRAWHTSSITDEGFREYLTFASPAEES